MKLKKLSCPNCNGKLDIKIADGTSSVFCPYCGQRFFIEDNKQEYTINKNININKTIHKRYTNDADVIRTKNEAKKNSRDFKETLIMMGIMFLIPGLLFGGLFLNKSINQAQGKISAGYHRDLVGKDYKTVKSHFEAAGFTNIELIDLENTGLAFWNEGKVDSISVGGNTSFESMDWFAPDTKVVISYH